MNTAFPAARLHFQVVECCRRWLQPAGVLGDPDGLYPVPGANGQMQAVGDLACRCAGRRRAKDVAFALGERLGGMFRAATAGVGSITRSPVYTRRMASASRLGAASVVTKPLTWAWSTVRIELGLSMSTNARMAQQDINAVSLLTARAGSRAHSSTSTMITSGRTALDLPDAVESTERRRRLKILFGGEHGGQRVTKAVTLPDKHDTDHLVLHDVYGVRVRGLVQLAGLRSPGKLQRRAAHPQSDVVLVLRWPRGSPPGRCPPEHATW
jgi:hypothetical protein